MNISDFYVGYGNFTPEAKVKHLETIFNQIKQEVTRNEEVVLDVLLALSDLESDDVFGTEGMSL